jgi:prepilin-type N-terminal cleavage/methylation domain-containing protein
MQMSRRRGFSMIELLTTLIIMGIIAAMAVPRIDMSRMRSDAAMRQITTLMVQAQRTALTKQHNVIISIDAAGSRLRLVEDKNNSNTYDAGDRAMWMALEPGVKFVPSPTPLDGMTGSVIFLKPRTIDGFPSVIFRRNGAASSDGAMFLSAKPTEITSVRAIGITQSTGRADGYKYTGTAWVRTGA